MKKLLQQIWPYVRNYKKYVYTAIVLLVPIALIKAYIAYFIKNVIDGIFDPSATLAYAFQLAFTVIGLTVLSYPIRYIHHFFMRSVVDLILCDIRRDLYVKFQNLPSRYFSEAKQGKLLATIISDTKLFAQSFNSGIEVIREPLVALGLFGVMIYHDWKLTLITFAIIPIFILVFILSGKRIKRYIKKTQEHQAVMTHHASEGLQGQKIIKAFGLQKFMQKRFDQAQKSFITTKRVSNSTEEHSHPFIEVLISFAFGVVIIASYLRAQDGQLSTGEFFSFVAAFGMFMDPIRRYAKANAKMSQAKAAADRVFKVMKLEEEVDQGEVENFEFKESIEFKNIDFSYGKDLVLKNFSLKINKGEKIALVGLSGSGKSTLISLLLRLYDLDKGEILVDGVNIKNYKLSTLRQKFALVSQDLFLFNDSVLENITAGENISEESLKEALEVSYVSEFLDSLPQGLDTLIGDRGLKLSGGQAQRLTIARAFLRNCPILLFDEATSALDNESERIVQIALEKVASSKTVLAIAHRLSSIQNYDRIIVLKNGEKVEEGTHQELLDNQGEYQKLFELSQ